MWGNKCLAAAVLTVACLTLAVTAQAQWGDPLLDLKYGTKPACPFDCDFVTLLVSGAVSSTSWQVPKLMSADRAGDSFCVRFDVVYDPGPALPVVVPFDLAVPVGQLTEGKYKVIYIFYLDNPIATMPMIPTVVDTFRFTVAPPGDQNCDAIVDINDVVDMIGFVFANQLAPDPSERADLNCDGTSNVVDVLGLISHTFVAGTICHPCRITPPLLYGRWRWVRAFGGIAAMERTPQTAGYTQTNIYGTDGIFEMLRDSVLQVRTPYTVRMEKSPPFPAGPVIYYADRAMIPQLISSVTGDSLKLIDLCMDCYEWTFARER